MGKLHPLQELRDTLDLSQEGFAAAVGKPLYQSTISTVEAFRSGLSRELALKLAGLYRTEMNGLGITVEDLLRGSRARPAA